MSCLVLAKKYNNGSACAVDQITTESASIAIWTNRINMGFSMAEEVKAYLLELPRLDVVLTL